MEKFQNHIIPTIDYQDPRYKTKVKNLFPVTNDWLINTTVDLKDLEGSRLQTNTYGLYLRGLTWILQQGFNIKTNPN